MTRLQQLTLMLERMADWKDDLEVRLSRARKRFEFELLAIEIRAYRSLCDAYAARVPGSLVEYLDWERAA